MVTNEEVIQWLSGTGNVDLTDMVELIKIIANGTYAPEQLKNDIQQYGRNR